MRREALERVRYYPAPWAAAPRPAQGHSTGLPAAAQLEMEAGAAAAGCGDSLGSKVCSGEDVLGPLRLLSGCRVLSTLEKRITLIFVSKSRAWKPKADFSGDNKDTLSLWALPRCKSLIARE